MRAGRRRTPRSWTSYFRDEPREHPDDKREGQWSRARLKAMDRKFVARLERAIARGEEHVTVTPCSPSTMPRLPA
jgi:hypothetical protein